MQLEISIQSTLVDSMPVPVKPDKASGIVRNLNGEDVATIIFETNAMYNFTIGSYAVIYGDTYYISRPPVVDKLSKFNYRYTLHMERRVHYLRHAQYLFYNSTNGLTEGDFSLTGTADDFINLLITNANRLGMGWIKGGVIVTGYKTMTFSKEDCLSVLSRIANEFETEFFVIGNTIHLARREQQTIHTFRYGPAQGLYNISRQVGDSPLITRLYVYGSQLNLPLGYRNFSPRLLMNSQSECLVSDVTVVVESVPVIEPDPPATEYTFTWVKPLNADITGVDIEYRVAGSSGAWTAVSGGVEPPRSVVIPTGDDYEFRFTSIGGSVCDSQSTDAVVITETVTEYMLATPSILEQNTLLHGVIEGTLVVDDIYPTREGVVTAGDVTNVYKFKDTSLEFDINDHLLPGIIAKVVFQSGQLAGYKFEIKNYNHGDKEFTLLKNRNEKALDVPNAFMKPAIGDKYILVDILLPQAYIDDAEEALREKGEEHLAKVSSPDYRYRVECDPAHFRKQRIRLDVGDRVRLVDPELQVDRTLRVVSLQRAMLDEFEYTIELADEAQRPGPIQTLQATTVVNTQSIQQASQSFSNNPIIDSGRRVGNLTIEDGTIIIEDIPVAGSTAGMKALYIDSDGHVWRDT